MSATKLKNASKVWLYFVRCVTIVPGKRYGLATVGEVASSAGMSYPTVKRYLEMAVSEGAAHKVNFGGRVMYGYGE